MSLQHSSDTPKNPAQAQKPYGSVIDAQGKEVPITEQMIQQACKELENSQVKRVGKG
ncbi:MULTISPECIES: PA1571 family protein [unclassified Pseudomonas]|uniref:PA1571 family protein n=1 Tax=unclassified Pseudomonas TaxID=196821 RepID=UPI0035BF175C